MEDRLTGPRAGRPAFALIALVLIVVITAAWWALALWPAGAVEPEWLSRTRAACFGSEPGGLPDAGGWILLIGQPLGMIVVLVAVWGKSLKAEIRAMRMHSGWRLLAGVAVLFAVTEVVTLSARVVRVKALAGTPNGTVNSLHTRLDLAAPVFSLTDQHGGRVSLADFHGRPALITFAFGHCTTVCPTIVRDMLTARNAAGRPDMRLIVVTLDPWRDTPERLPSIATHWQLGADDRVLSGSVREVEAALDALGIGRRRDETTGEIEHSGTVLLLDGRSRITWRLDGDWRRATSLLVRR